jgi:hypothetical protein
MGNSLGRINNKYKIMTEQIKETVRGAIKDWAVDGLEITDESIDILIEEITLRVSKLNR